MPEPVDPVDPFTALGQRPAPLAPRPEFAARLRQRLSDELADVLGRRDAPTTQEVATVTTTGSGTAATAAPPASPLSPYLVVDGAAAALDWYRDVLGAIELTRFVDDHGKVGHAEVAIGGARLMLADEYPELDLLAPARRGGTSVTLHLEVVDVDHSHRRAVEEGARSERPPADQGHGNRNATVIDPFGHRWMLSAAITADRAAAAEPEGPEVGRTWTVTGRQPVEPGYLTIHTADLARATAFFGDLFAWDVEPGAREGGGHVANTRFPLGLTGPADDGRATTVYFRVDDIEPVARRVEQLGGRVLGRYDYASGGNAECVDDQGYRFDLFQPAPGY